MVSESYQIGQLEKFIAQVAQRDSTVLIRGESGTGKELVARAIHSSSPRAERPFVAINCAAIPEALLESELFGHEKGAFTGAIATKRGKLEVVEDGTAFFDEIGELAPILQAKLLRVLQQKEFERLGGHRSLTFKARVLAATNKNRVWRVSTGICIIDSTWSRSLCLPYESVATTFRCSLYTLLRSMPQRSTDHLKAFRGRRVRYS